MLRSRRTPSSRSVSYLALRAAYFIEQSSTAVDNLAYPHFDIYPTWLPVQAVPVAEQVTKARECHRELHHEVFPTSPSDLGESESQTGSVLGSSPPRYPAYPALEICQLARLLPTGLSH